MLALLVLGGSVLSIYPRWFEQALSTPTTPSRPKYSTGTRGLVDLIFPHLSAAAILISPPADTDCKLCRRDADQMRSVRIMPSTARL